MISSEPAPADQSKDPSQTAAVSEANSKKGIMDRLSAKISRTSGPPPVAKEEEVIKFKLVEDIRLVTIPITSCLCVLLSYLVFGAILFAHWEVRPQTSSLSSLEHLEPQLFRGVATPTILCYKEPARASKAPYLAAKQSPLKDRGFGCLSWFFTA